MKSAPLHWNKFPDANIWGAKLPTFSFNIVLKNGLYEIRINTASIRFLKDSCTTLEQAKKVCQEKTDEILMAILEGKEEVKDCIC